MEKESGKEYTHTHNKHTYICMYRDFLVAKTVKNLPTIQETQVQTLGWEDPLEKERLATPVFLPGEFHGQRSLVGYIVQGIAKSWTQLSDQHQLMYVKLNNFALHLKLTQHCKSTILQFFKKNYKNYLYEKLG